MSVIQNSDERVFVIRIDHDDRIIFVNEHWLAFARENGTEELLEKSLLGQNLWQHICDDTTTHLYHTMITSAREEGHYFTIPFRCDSPDCRRFMEMKIIPSDNGAVTLESKVVKLESREHVKLLDSDIERSDKLIQMCSYCKKVLAADSNWYEVEQAIALLDLFAEDKPPQITHTICPACYEEYNKVLNMVKAKHERDSI